MRQKRNPLNLSSRDVLLSPEDEYLRPHIKWSPKSWYPSYKSQWLHTYLATTVPPEEVDHKNGLSHDCRRENLRVTTHCGNMINRTRTLPQVTYHKRTKLWWAGRTGIVTSITHGKLHGPFQTKGEAEFAFNELKQKAIERETIREVASS